MIQLRKLLSSERILRQNKRVKVNFMENKISAAAPVATPH
jgi:hypothetical protein